MSAAREQALPTDQGPADLRAVALGAVAWAGALAALLAPGRVVLAVLALLALGVGWRHHRGRDAVTGMAWLTAAAGVVASTMLRAETVSDNPVAALAGERGRVSVELVTTGDPAPGRRRGHGAEPGGSPVVLRARTQEVTGRGRTQRVRVPVLVIADEQWRRLGPGTRVRAAGRLQPARSRDLSAVLSTRGPPQVVERPGLGWRGAAHVRAAIRDAVARQPPGPRALVPALVDGDETGMDGDLEADFRIAGLTHLTAVSGTNLTLVLGALLLLARALGVRARGLVLVGLLGVVGFVLLARTEPSVVRAATMGAVGLLGLGQHGRRRGTRALGAAVLLLLLLDPWLATSVGFALSVLATAGILWLVPGWRDRLVTWLPRWVAEAVSVPLAAQLACTPLVAAISGQVSLVAVIANVLAAPAVGPATVLGLAGGAVGLLWGPLGQLVATPAGWSAAWIIAVARRSADLPVAAVGWRSEPWAIAALAILCTALALGLGPLLARRTATVAASALLAVVLLVPLPTPGWPPEGWVMVACDVGQGDALVLRAGAGSAVVVDAGPEAAPVDRCLRRLGVRRVPLVVLTHFHADHVGGLDGVLGGRRVGAIEVTGLADPPGGARLVETLAARAGVPVRRASYGETGLVGSLRWQVLAPSRPVSPGSASPPNDASVVLLVETRGLRLLLMGDEEEPSQARLRRDLGQVRADVLKVAHHGSARQDPELLRGLGARLAVISVGADNDYGHPAPSLLSLLRESRMRVARTDLEGDVAVSVEDGRLRVRGRGGGPGP